MSDKICVLVVLQGSNLEQEILSSHKIYKSNIVWADTGTPVDYPISSDEKRPRKFVDETYCYLYFNDIAAKYREDIDFVNRKDNPSWGESWWIAGHRGLVELYKKNWDSSD